MFGAIQSPLAQPRNVIGGQIISALIGVTIAKFIPDIIWLTAPLAVATSIIAMQFTKTLHPPGGATALIAIIGTENIKNLGYFYVLSPPVLSGSLTLLVVALIFNNMTKHRSYPTNGSLTNAFKSKGLKG
ncbi:membrane protein [Algibacter lectus]|uniref:Membrane protein n=1 Tax=Algibacter lectus TaxID=221126 RepID=A0A090X1Y3_9FLAO|nr:membrane protein [Algibacter lectus]